MRTSGCSCAVTPAARATEPAWRASVLQAAGGDAGRRLPAPGVATMTIAVMKYGVIVGLTLALTAATCSVAHSRAGADPTRQLAQYCAPSDNWELPPRVFCGQI